ncbi:hypothetical protein BG011_008650 [Mortierella polycephala]|uniref:Uncharacterized protein n=1 Tax=Mortierella polycephala TaxID=41804 RepID=A0A9P6PQS2_9FUNG|nr:hypothetical protein BG011_008650 [Mortierella polycephala]
MYIQDALVSCTKLRRFWVEPDFFSTVSLNVDDVAQGDDWGCLGMKELYLKLCRGKLQPEGAATGNEKDTRAFAGSQRLYEQIGRLVDLEILALDYRRGMISQQIATIGGYAWDLTLSKGGLRNLSGLKKLRKLSLRADFYSKMSQADVEFIDAEWPQLEVVEFRNVYSKSSVASLRTQFHRIRALVRHNINLTFVQINAIVLTRDLLIGKRFLDSITDMR